MLRIVRLFISHAFFAACCAVALCLQTYRWLHLPVALPVLGFVFFATIASYNYHFFVAGVAQYPIRHWHRFLFRNSHGFLILPAFISAGCCYSLMTVPLPLILLAMAGSFLYTLPLWPVAQLQLFRNAGILKTILLAFIWAWVSCINIPVRMWPTSWLPILLFSWRFFLVFLLCILFDRRDRQRDLQNGYHSVATDLEPHSLALLYWAGWWLWGFISIILSAILWNPAEAVAQWLVLAAVGVSWIKLQQQSGFWYYYLLVDGYMFLSGCISILLG